MKLNLFRRLFRPKVTATVITEERTHKNGHLYIKRETKTGDAALKAIKEHRQEVDKLVDEIIGDIHEQID